MDRGTMPAEPHYPDPSTAQVGGGPAPFYTSHDAHMHHELQPLQHIPDTHRALLQHHHHHEEDAEGDQEYEMHPGAHVAEDALREAASQHETLAQHVMSMHGGEHDHGEHDHDEHVHASDAPEFNSRKRTKISRACDECRRKKVRCDPATDGSNSCHNCARNNVVCLFSREPLKRGPSKGYIKDLADKITYLEDRIERGALGQPGATGGVENPQSASAISRDGDPAPQAIMARKRTHSMSESGTPGANHGFEPQRPTSSSYSAVSAQRHLPPPPSAPYSGNAQPSATDPNFGPRKLLVAPMSGKWDLRGANRPAVGVPSSVPREDEETIELAASAQIDKGVIDEYYRFYHPYFPLLPHSSSRLCFHVAKLSMKLRGAFVLALYGAVRTAPGTTVEPLESHFDTVKTASDLLSECHFNNDGSDTTAEQIGYIQALLLMGIEADNRGPSPGSLGPSRSEWFARAMNAVKKLPANVGAGDESYDIVDPLVDTTNSDSAECVSRRLWWVLFILDRWEACAFASVPQLPERKLRPEDREILGETASHLTRISVVIGHFAELIKEPSTTASTGAAELVRKLILREMERIDDFAPTTAHAAIHWFFQTLVYRLEPTFLLHMVLHRAGKIVDALDSDDMPSTPLNHHFLMLAVVSLMECSELSETRANAKKNLGQILGMLDEGTAGMEPNSDGSGWYSAIRDVVAQRVNVLANNDVAERGSINAAIDSAEASGLQHLADAAIGDSTATGNSDGVNTNDRVEGPFTITGVEASLLTRRGYMNALNFQAAN